MCIFALGVKKHEHSVDIEVKESKDIRKRNMRFIGHSSITAVRIIVVKFNSQHKLLPGLNVTQEALHEDAEAHDQHHDKSFQPQTSSQWSHRKPPIRVCIHGEGIAVLVIGEPAKGKKAGDDEEPT